VIATYFGVNAKILFDGFIGDVGAGPMIIDTQGWTVEIMLAVREY
jgi:hypothetical protein